MENATSSATDPSARVSRIASQARAGIILLCALAAPCGCAPRDTVYKDIAASRARSYQKWLDEKESALQSDNVLRAALSREQCVLIALERNKQIAAVIWDKEKAQGRITEAYSAAMPRLDLGGSVNRVDRSSRDIENTYGLSATLSQPLYRGGAVGAGVRAARIYSYASDERQREVIQNVIFEVNKAYYDVLLSQELVRVSEEAVDLSQKHVEDVMRRSDAGVASAYDVLRGRVEVTNYEAEMIQNRNRLHLLKSSFYKLLGISQESDITFSDPLRYEESSHLLEDAVSEAFLHKPELQQAELMVRLYQEGLKAAKGERMPTLDAFFTETYASPGPHVSSGSTWGSGWTTGLNLRFPLFDGFRTKGRIRQARADLEKSRTELLDAEENALLSVKQAILSIEDARTFVESQKANVERAAEGLKLVEAGYREGVNTELEVRDARQALLRASSLHYQAIYQHQVAVLGLKKATGSLHRAAEQDEK